MKGKMTAAASYKSEDARRMLTKALQAEGVLSEGGVVRGFAVHDDGLLLVNLFDPKDIKGDTPQWAAEIAEELAAPVRRLLDDPEAKDMVERLQCLGYSPGQVHGAMLKHAKDGAD